MSLIESKHIELAVTAAFTVSGVVPPQFSARSSFLCGAGERLRLSHHRRM